MVKLTITSEPRFYADTGASGKSSAEALTEKGQTIRVGWWGYKGIEKGQEIFCSNLEKRTYTPKRGKNEGIEQTEYTVTFPKGEYPDVEPPDSYGNNGGGGGGGSARPQTSLPIHHESQLRNIVQSAFARSLVDLGVTQADLDAAERIGAAMSTAISIGAAYTAGLVTLDLPKAQEEQPPPPTDDDLPY